MELQSGCLQSLLAEDLKPRLIIYSRHRACLAQDSLCIGLSCMILSNLLRESLFLGSLCLYESLFLIFSWLAKSPCGGIFCPAHPIIVFIVLLNFPPVCSVSPQAWRGWRTSVTPATWTPPCRPCPTGEMFPPHRPSHWSHFMTLKCSLLHFTICLRSLFGGILFFKFQCNPSWLKDYFGVALVRCLLCFFFLFLLLVFNHLLGSSPLIKHDLCSLRPSDGWLRIAAVHHLRQQWQLFLLLPTGAYVTNKQHCSFLPALFFFDHFIFYCLSSHLIVCWTYFFPQIVIFTFVFVCFRRI